MRYFAINKMINKKFTLYFIVSLLVLAVTASCNKKDEEEEEISYRSSSTSTVLVGGFNLVADDDVMENLDSVFFTIDAENYEIYNADSLPVGTNITALKVNLTFNSTVSEALFNITGASEHKDTSFVYSSTETEIDFTGKVTVNVTSYDKSASRKYTIKVNVHKMEPDSLYWNKSLRRDLPGVGSEITSQKMVQTTKGFTHLSKTDGQLMLSVADKINSDSWNSHTISFPGDPQVETLVAAGDVLYILNDDGELFKSEDGDSWTDCGVMWTWILGSYGDKVLGVLDDGGYKHDEYPRGEGFTPAELEDGFPYKENSMMVYADNPWGVSQQGVIAGGRLPNGNASDCIWGYDGTSWGQINDSYHTDVIPRLLSPVIFPYVSFNTNTSTLRVTQLPTWFLMGGKGTDGAINSKVFVSLDQGILWSESSSKADLPDYVKPFSGAQVFVVTEKLSRPADLAPRRAGAVRPVTEWDCPYVYIVGGKDKDGKVINSIWKIAFNRLTFIPIY